MVLLEKPQILKTAKELWAAYQEKHPQADLLDFYREHSFDLRRAGKEILEERGKPKALFTAEDHPAVSARAELPSGGIHEKLRALWTKLENFSS